MEERVNHAEANTPTPTHKWASKSHRDTQTHTFDGADHLLQVFEVVAVGPAARADLQRVVGSVLCKKLAHGQRVRAGRSI